MKKINRDDICRVGDTVMFKGRKWFYVDNTSGKAILHLMPNEKPYYQNFEAVNMLTTKDITAFKRCI